MKKIVKPLLIIAAMIPIETLGDRTLAKYIENKIGKVTFPILQNAFNNNREPVQFALSKILKKRGVVAAEEIASQTLGELINTVNLEQGQAKSPVKLRVYDSRRQVTGLLNGKMKHEIPRSVYKYKLREVKK